MKENFFDTTAQILCFKSHRDLNIRKMVITMIPSLAAYDTRTFTEHFLHKAMAHLLTQFDKPNERSFGKPSFTVPRANIKTA
jgi:serine/threonine-protein kinase mTOR